MAVMGFSTFSAAASSGTFSVERIETSFPGPLAPASIQARNVSMWAADGCAFLRGGMAGFFFPSRSWSRREPPASPGLIEGPSSPPFMSCFQVSSENSPLSSSSLWQPAQYSRRMGATSRWKSISAPRAVSVAQATNRMARVSCFIILSVGKGIRGWSSTPRRDLRLLFVSPQAEPRQRAR